MRLGKISENVLKRSVLRKLKVKRQEIVSGAGIGKDCAILALGDGYETVLSSTPVTASCEELSVYAILSALNNIAVVGAEPVGVMLTLMLPQEYEEKDLQTIMGKAQQICDENNVDILGGHTEVTDAVNQPVVTVTGVGKREIRYANQLTGIRADMDIVVSKWIGLEATARLAKEKAEALRSRYPVRMIEDAAGYDKYLSVIPEAATAIKSGVCGMHDVSRGGIFGALWEMASGAGVGLEIDMKKIPVRQETIEICEFLELNPYEIMSGGCLMMVTKDGNGLVSALLKEEIPAVIIGRTTDSNDRVLFLDDEKRYLDMPKTDQLYFANGTLNS